MELAITLFPLLPAVVAVIAITRGSRLAVISFMVLALQLAWWLAYEYTGWIGNPGMGGVWKFYICPTLASLVIATIALALTFNQPGDRREP